MKDKSVEELLRIIKSNKDAKVKKDTSKISSFINAFSIKVGQEFVSAFLIYETYLRWSRKAKKLSKITFFKQFNYLFESTRKKGERGYLISHNNINTSKEEYRRLKKLAKVRAERKAKRDKEKVNKKVKSKKCRTN
jgi:uncharacterized radical SAM superfamily Fe-S cluster-containing enzyme